MSLLIEVQVTSVVFLTPAKGRKEERKEGKREGERERKKERQKEINQT